VRNLGYSTSRVVNIPVWDSTQKKTKPTEIQRAAVQVGLTAAQGMIANLEEVHAVAAVARSTQSAARKLQNGEESPKVTKLGHEAGESTRLRF
jgi:hypothetical protein